MIAGNIYGVVLNDKEELAKLTPQLSEKPYNSPPIAPVVYMKPRICIAKGLVTVPAGTELSAAATVALLFARDAANVAADAALATVGAACLAIDLMIPHDSYYRPTVAQRNGNGFLPIGDFAAFTMPGQIDTSIDGKAVHTWSLDRLIRPASELISTLSRFMTFRAGDVLLIGLAGDAPIVRAGQDVRVEAPGLPALSVRIEEARA